MALSLGGAVEAHYIRLLKRRREAASPHPHSSLVLEMDPQGRTVTLMQIRRAYRGRAHARLTETSAAAADGALLDA